MNWVSKKHTLKYNEIRKLWKHKTIFDRKMPLFSWNSLQFVHSCVSYRPVSFRLTFLFLLSVSTSRQPFRYVSPCPARTAATACSVALARICFFVFARSPCTVRCEHTAACHSCQSSINYIPRMSPHLYLYDCMNMGECNDRSRITTAGETEKENRESAEKN